MEAGKQRLFQPGKTSAAQQLCPRLIDYLVIVGRRPNAATRRRRIPNGQNTLLAGGTLLGGGVHTAGTISHPELLRRYPHENHKDFELPRDVVYFCQPEGCISFSGSTLRQLKRRHMFNEATSFVFTLTEKDTAKVRYGITLNFFLALGSRHSNENVRHEQQQTTSHVGSVPHTPTTVGTAGSSHQHHPLQHQQRPSSSHASNTGVAHQISMCLISHHPFLSAFRDLLMLFRQLVDCCNHRANQDDSLPRDAVWTVLTGHWPSGITIPTPLMQELKQLETWLFTLLSSPVPVPGKTKLLLEVLPPDMMPIPLEFALPDHTRFSLVDFPLHLPLELLGVETVMQILAAIMLEYKVILQSRNYNAVSMCVLALIALLYPLEYMFPVIPLLPVFMPSAEQLLLAPTPYIIGVPASFFHCKGIQVPSDVLLVDLDSNQLSMPTDQTVHIPQFPKPEADMLKDEFLRAMGRQQNAKNGQVQNGTNNANCASFDFASVSVPSIDNDEIDVNCRIAMIHFYNGQNVFANFTEHTRTIRLYPRPVVALQVDSFLRSRGQKSELQFITELCRTQAVEYFAECSLCPSNETYVRVQAGVTSAQQIGDKAKWFAETLMPVHFNAYPYGSLLSEAIFLARIDSSQSLLERTDSENIEDDDSGGCTTTGTPSDLESVGSADAGGWSPFGSRSPLNLLDAKPLSDAMEIYRAPNHLELPQSESALSIDSSDMSSCRSSPVSVIDSEADFARLAENMALKRNARGDFTFNHSGHATDDETATICEEFVPDKGGGGQSDGGVDLLNSEYEKANKFSPSMQRRSPIDHRSREPHSSLFGGRPMLMDALNGYVERGHGVFNQMVRRTAPTTQVLREKAKPLAEAVGTRMEVAKVRQFLNRPKQNDQHQEQPSGTMLTNVQSGQTAREISKQQSRDNAAATTAAQQQRKNQQQITEVCEQVLAGHGIGVFAGSKIKRLLEDENLRELVCSKLNQGLDVKYAEDECIQDVQLNRAQYKGYLRLLLFCNAGLEHSFNTPGSNGMASAFHVLEIAHTHFWSQNDSNYAQTPGSNNSGDLRSVLSSPSMASVQNSTIGNSGSGAIISPSSSGETNPPTLPITPINQPSISSASSPSFLSHKTTNNNNDIVSPSATSALSIKASHIVVPPPTVPPPPLPSGLPPAPSASCSSTVFTISMHTPPPPLPARPPALPPRIPPALTRSNACTESTTEGNAIGKVPPPLPKRPSSGDSVKTDNRVPGEEDKPLEIMVKDKVDVEKRPAEGAEKLKQENERKQPPPTLNLSALEQMLPARSNSSTAGEIPPKHFIYQDLLSTSTSTSNVLWQRMPFWETAFLDMVAQERDKIGMDQEPAEMIDRYSQLSEMERKRLELEEDRILATLLHNMTAMMHLCHVPIRIIQQKVRRLLGKAHIGLVYSKRINKLLDELITLPTNTRIPLKPLGSRLIQKHVFPVHEGSTPEGPVCFLEICDDAVILRDSVNGIVQERWWYERMVNMTYSPKTRVLCLWRRQDDQVHMHKFHTKKCRSLYNTLKAAMERAASRGKYQTAGKDLGGEFPIHDVERNEGGLLQVRIDGVQLQFASSQEMIDLNNIKKCNTYGGNMFILEEYDRSKGQLIQRRYISSVADQICYAVLCVFSFVAAYKNAANQQKKSAATTTTINSSATSVRTVGSSSVK